MTDTSTSPLSSVRVRPPLVAPPALTIPPVAPSILQPVAPPPLVITEQMPAAMGKKGKMEKPAGSNTLADVMATISKLHGPNLIRPATQALTTFMHIPFNVFVLDMALFGGIPQSLIAMIYGWESSGKTTAMMRNVAATQKRLPDKQVVWVDAEGTFDAVWAARHGVDVNRLILVQPETGEQAVDVIDAVLRASDISLVVLDSIPALMPAKELEKSAEDATVALQARLIGLLVRKATQAILDERKKGHLVTLVLINQWRSKIVMMGDPRSLPGGNALKFFVATRIEIKNNEVMGKDNSDVETVDYNEHSFKITKNKIGTGIRSGEFRLIRNPSHPMGPGYIDENETVLVYARKFGVFTGGGSSWRLDDVDLRFNRIMDGVTYLTENPAYCDQLKQRLITQQRRNSGLSMTGWQ